MRKFDVIVIGGGPGGYLAAIRASRHGKSVLLLERLQVGGTCLNRGCIPTKAMLQSAHVFQQAKNAAVFGIEISAAGFDLKKIADRRNHIVKTMRNGVEMLLKKAGVTVAYKRARLVGNKTVQAGEQTYSAEYIILATGCMPVVPPIPGIETEGVITSDQALERANEPKSVVIVGGGVIGLEFAAFYSSLGIPVTILEALPEILPGIDRDIVQSVLQGLVQNGVEVYCNARVEHFENGITTVFTQEGAAKTGKSDMVLVATGRRPLTENIGLGTVGVAGDSRGFIPVNKYMQTNIPHIYAIGDITGKQQLAHLAMAQAVVAADHICGLAASTINLNMVPACIYTTPEIATIGRSKSQAISAGREVLEGSFRIAGNGRSMVLGETTGSAKIVICKNTGQILGAAICAPSATEIIAEIAAVMRAEGTIEELCNTIHPHPTVSEIVWEAAHDAVGLCHHKPCKSV